MGIYFLAKRESKPSVVQLHGTRDRNDAHTKHLPLNRGANELV